MTDKVKQVIWVFNSEKNKNQRIQLRTLLDRVNGTYKQRYLNKSVKYFALGKTGMNLRGMQILIPGPLA